METGPRERHRSELQSDASWLMHRPSDGEDTEVGMAPRTSNQAGVLMLTGNSMKELDERSG